MHFRQVNFVLKDVSGKWKFEADRRRHRVDGTAIAREHGDARLGLW
jgi:hypothetical protein